MSEKQKVTFHPRRFKAYLNLVEKTQSQVARDIGMPPGTFNNKVNMKPGRKSLQFPVNGKLTRTCNYYIHFNDDECLRIVQSLGMSEEKQLEIFECVLVPHKAVK